VSKRNAYILPRIFVLTLLKLRQNELFASNWETKMGSTALMWACASTGCEREGKSDIWSLATSGLEQRARDTNYFQTTEFQPEQQNKSS
jgi:hypothetical protein